MAEGMQLQPGEVSHVNVLRDLLDEVEKEDLRGVWDALGLEGHLTVEQMRDNDPDPDEHLMITCEELEKMNGESDWIRLGQIMDMTKDE